MKIRRATRRDVPLILRLIRELACYEKLAHEVVASEELLRETLFGRRRNVPEVLLAYQGRAPAGFAVFFHTFSTFLGRPGLYLEDLYIKPEWRGRGIGKALLVRVAQIAVERKCGRLEWCVLGWNKPAIDFYEKLGAIALKEWTVFRVSGRALARLAKFRMQNSECRR